MNVEKQANASSWVGMVYKKGAERTFMPTRHQLSFCQFDGR